MVIDQVKESRSKGQAPVPTPAGTVQYQDNSQYLKLNQKLDMIQRENQRVIQNVADNLRNQSDASASMGQNEYKQIMMALGKVQSAQERQDKAVKMLTNQNQARQNETQLINSKIDQLALQNSESLRQKPSTTTATDQAAKSQIDQLNQ